MPFKEKIYTGKNSSGTHRMVYSDWGDESARPIICVHGLTGNGRDFDEIAPVLVKDGYRPVCVDLAGRGRSDFLAEPKDYNYDLYCEDLLGLMTELGITKADWLGVSLGGLLGIRIAGDENSPIQRLILNDVGPEVPQNALDFIHTVISKSYRFDTIHDLEKRMRETRGLTWGPVTDDQWRLMAEHNARALPDGALSYGYDPGIAVNFKVEPTGARDLWPSWKRIDCPVLIIHGKKSVVLTAEIVNKMRAQGPDTDYVAFSDCGHVPSLMAPEQIKAIQKWLSSTQI